MKRILLLLMDVLSVREDEMTIIATDINDFEQKNTNKLILILQV